MYKIFLTCSLMAAMTVNASAYLDPSVMTYTIQVVAGVVVAVGAVVGVYWRKAKKKVQDSLGMDENAKKTLEESSGTWEEEENSVNIHNKFLLRAENSNKNKKQLVEILLQRAVFCIFRRRIYTNCTEPARGVFRLHTYLFVMISKNFILF